MPKPYNGGKPTFNEGITPIGLICHCYHDKPQLKTKDQNGRIPDIDPETNLQIAEYKVTLAWSKQRENELGEMYNMALLTQDQGWPGSRDPGAFFQLEPFFRDGDNPAHNTKNKDYLRGRYYLNFKQRAKAARDPMTGQVVYSGAPGLLGPYGPDDKIMPADLWPGCTGRVSFIMFATEYMGKHFISTRLQNIQKYDEGDGSRIGGGARPTAESQFGALREGQGGSFPNGGLGGFGGGFGQSQPQQGGNMFGGAGGAFGQPQGGNMFGGGGGQPQQGSNMFGNAGQNAGGGFGAPAGRRIL